MRIPSRAVSWAVILGVGIGVLVALAFGLRVFLSNWILQRALDYFSLPLSAEVTVIDGNQLVIRGLIFAAPGQPRFEAEELQVHFAPSALLEGRAKQMILRRPVIELPGVEEEARDGQQIDRDAEGEAALPWPPPFLIEHLVIEDGALLAEHEGHKLRTAFEAEAKLTAGEPWSAALDVTFDGDLGAGKLAMTTALDQTHVRRLEVHAKGRLLPTLDALLPDQVGLHETGEIALSLTLQSDGPFPIPSSLEGPALGKLARSALFNATLEAEAKGLKFPGWAETANLEFDTTLAGSGDEAVLADSSRLRITAQPSPDLPQPFKATLAPLGVTAGPLTLSLERQADGVPLAIVSFNQNEAFVDLAVSAALSGQESHRLDLSAAGQLHLNTQDGEVLAAEFFELEGECRCLNPSTQSPLRLSAATAVRLAEGRIELPQRFTASLASESEEDLTALIPTADLEGLLGPSLEMHLVQRNLDAPLLSYDQATDARLAWNVDANLESHGALTGARLTSRGAATLPGDDTPLRLEWTDFDLALGKLAWRGQDLSSLRVTGLVEGNPEDAAGRARLSLNANSLQAGDLAIADLSLESVLAARKSGADLRVTLTEPSTLGLAGIEGLPVRLSSPLQVALQTMEARVPLGTGAGWALETEGDIAALQLRAEGRAVQVGGSRFEASLAGDTREFPEGEARIQVDMLSLSDPAVRTGPTALALKSDGTAIDMTLAPTLVTQSAVPATANKVALSGSARLAENRLTGRARASLPKSDVRANLRFRHDLKTARGRTDIEVPEITFSPIGLQPSALSPLLGGIEAASGSLSAKARVTWQGDRLEGSGEASLTSLSFKRQELFVEDFETAIVLSSLFPLASDGPQSFAATRAGSGDLALDNIGGRFEITNEGPESAPTLRLKDAQGDFVGGQVRLAGQVFQPDGIVEAGRIEVADIDLAQLLSRLRIDGLSATGQLSGQLPLRFEDDTLIIEGGQVSANAPGRVAYNSPTARQALATAGDHMKLTLDALQDFTFSNLVLRLDKPATGDSELAITLEGSNPAVLDNYPFRFNIRLTGDPAPFITAITEGTRLSDEILRRAWTLSGSPPY